MCSQIYQVSYLGWWISRHQNTGVPAPVLILLVDLGARAVGSRSAGLSDWSAGCVCAGSAACPFECAGDWRGSFPWTICLAGCPHNKEGPRMVLVHVGYLVLPVFGSVRNRGMTSYTFSHSNTNNFLCVSSFLNSLKWCKQSWHLLAKP